MQNQAHMKPLHIGAVTVDFPVLLAPMAGYTDAVMRDLARRRHCGMAYTEMANADGIARGSKPTEHVLETGPDEKPVAAHLYGHRPETLARAAAMVEQTGRFQVIDLNCGCPVSKIVARGAGAALMKHPDKIAEIVQAVRKAVSLPVTVKTRLGLTPDRMNISEIAQAAEDSGASAITIHARFADARHTGPVDWPALARVKSERKIPVIGNGGVRTADDARRMLAETGVDGVMIGQAAIGNPWIFDETWEVLHGRRPAPHSVREHRAVIEEHLRLLIEHKAQAIRAGRRPRRNDAERDAVLHFRAHLAGYIRGFKKSAVWRRQFSSMTCLADVLAMLEELRAAPGFDRLED